MESSTPPGPTPATASACKSGRRPSSSDRGRGSVVFFGFPGGLRHSQILQHVRPVFPVISLYCGIRRTRLRCGGGWISEERTPIPGPEIDKNCSLNADIQDDTLGDFFGA